MYFFFFSLSVFALPTVNSFSGFCPEDNFDVKGVTCQPDLTNCDELVTEPPPVTRPQSNVTMRLIPVTDEVTTVRGKREVTEEVTADNSTQLILEDTVTSSSSVETTTTRVPKMDYMTTMKSELATVTTKKDKKSPKITLSSKKKCRAAVGQCPKGAVIFKAHGPLTGNCVRSDR